MQRADDFAHLGPSQRIVDVLALAARFNQAVHTQAGQLLRNGWLTQTEYLFDLGDSFFPFRQHAKR